MFSTLSDIPEQPFYPHLDDILAAVEYCPHNRSSCITGDKGVRSGAADLGGMDMASFGDAENGRYRREMPG